MKRAMPGYATMVFQGSEASAESRDRRLILPDAWYLGRDDGHVDYGPFDTEQRAVNEMNSLTDTRGT